MPPRALLAPTLLTFTLFSAPPAVAGASRPATQLFADVEARFAELRDLQDALDVAEARGLTSSGSPADPSDPTNASDPTNSSDASRAATPTAPTTAPAPRQPAPTAGAAPPPEAAAATAAAADTFPAGDRLQAAAGARTSDLQRLAHRRDQLRDEVYRALAAFDPTSLAAADRSALASMIAARPAFGEPETATVEESPPATVPSARPADAKAPPTQPDLREALYAAYAAAAAEVPFDGETLDRLTIFGRLADTTDPATRRRLFLALSPVWATVNGDGSPEGSPYRRLVRQHATPFHAPDAALARNLAALGLDLATVESWLLAVLAAWRDATRGERIEPWDWHFTAGELSRQLSPAISREHLRTIHDAYYRALGADPAALAIRYDLDPRPGKTPVAFATFGRRPRLASGQSASGDAGSAASPETNSGTGPETGPAADPAAVSAADSPASPAASPAAGSEAGTGKLPAAELDLVQPGEAWVFATYRQGGFDNLVELLHETGHAVHILAIRTRPAFADWPDSDAFTEALADVPALDAYEPWFQQHLFGQSPPLAVSLRAKYAGILLDTAWALFELRMHQDPTLDPNQVWAAITSEYLHITPHPELSWWAMRGQLIDAPGYMLNYGLGAILAADLRRAWQRSGTAPVLGGVVPAAAAEGIAPPDRTAPAPTTAYTWLSRELYRFGLTEPSRVTIERVLARPLSPAALLADLRRLRDATAGRPGE